jgi:hypothetical protein
LVKKTAVKKAAAKKIAATKPPTSLKEIQEIDDDLQSLELDLRNLRDKMKVLFHDFYVIGPKPPTHKK